MVKKVIDIFPPGQDSPDFSEKKSEHPFENKRPKNILQNKGKFSIFRQQLFSSVTPPSRRKKLVLGIVLGLILAFVSLHFFSAKTEVEIWPRTEPFEYQDRVIIDEAVKETDLILRVIPGKIFEMEKTISGNFQSSGSVLKRAEGVIRLYNEFTTQPETWRANTRFVSSEGKLFLSKEAIKAPGAVMREGKLVASFVDVPVIAAEGGSEYNIKPSHFSIVVYLGTPRYTKYYGESLESMTGGGKVSQVTEEDLEKAKTSLVERLKKELETDFKNIIPEGFAFLPEAFQIDVLEERSSVEANTEMDKFNFWIKVKAKTIAFDANDIKEISALLVLSQISTEERFHQKGLKIDYQLETVDLELGRLSLVLNIATKIYPDIDREFLKKFLAGKSVKEAKNFLDGQIEIIRSEIRQFPLWRKSVPNNLERINIELRID